MPKIIAASYGLRVADGYPIRKNLYDLGFSWLPVSREWSWKLQEGDPICGLEMAVTLQNLGATFASDPYSKDLERVVNLYSRIKELLGVEEARNMFTWLLGSEPEESAEAKQCWREAWEIILM